MADPANFQADFANMATAYQRKLMKMTEDNIRFALEYAEALSGAKSPTDFVEINTSFTTKRMELFKQHTAELAELSPFQGTTT
jgi:hypothetical protein